VIYLGANVPEQKFKETIQKTDPDLVIMTSMRLTTAATLRDAALFIQELDIPLAFGGRIFNILPELAKNIPGYFLGDDILKSISEIEDLLIKPLPPIEYRPEPPRFEDTIANFIQMKDRIDNQVLRSLTQKFGNQLPLNSVQEANEYLAKDMIAALTLGEINYLGSNVEWVENMLAHRDFSQSLVFDYLESYFAATQSYLDQSGRPIIEWLATILSSKPSSN